MFALQLWQFMNRTCQFILILAPKFDTGQAGVRDSLPGEARTKTKLLVLSPHHTQSLPQTIVTKKCVSNAADKQQISTADHGPGWVPTPSAAGTGSAQSCLDCQQPQQSAQWLRPQATAY